VNSVCHCVKLALKLYRFSGTTLGYYSPVLRPAVMVHSAPIGGGILRTEIELRSEDQNVAFESLAFLEAITSEC